MATASRAGINRNKNQAMAAQMAALGITRTTGACPMCHHDVKIGNLGNHLFTCRGRVREYKGKPVRVYG